MNRDDDWWGVLESIAKIANDRRTAQFVNRVGRAVKRRVSETSVRVLDGVVSRIAGAPVHTETPEQSPTKARAPSSDHAQPAASTAAKVADEPRSASPVDTKTATEPDVADPAAATPIAPVEAPAPVGARPEATDAVSAERPAEAGPRGAGDTSPPAKKRFGIDRVVLLIRHANRAFAYWEIDERRVANAERAELLLIDTDGDVTVASADVAPRQGRHYFDVPESGRTYVAELVAFTGDDAMTLSRSTPVQAPA